MTVVYTLTPELRAKLKEPFGILIQGTFQETMQKMKELVGKEKPSVIISVGDVVSKNLHEFNIHPQLTVIDYKSLRNQTIPREEAVEKTVYVNNPQGTITQQAISAIKIALKKNEHTHIVVEGEEDLLTLIAVMYAPENAFIVYGQPHSGIVVVKVSLQRKTLVKKLLKTMKCFEKLNKAKTV
jgi:GTP-dependent dephospho-CoA kinase